MKNDLPAVRCSYTILGKTDEQKPNPRNYNKHPPKQLVVYAKILKRQGWRKPIVVSNQSGFIVTGHGAWLTARANGWEEVPIDRQDFASPADERAHMIADNGLPQMSEEDKDMLDSLKMELVGGGFDMELTGLIPNSPKKSKLKTCMEVIVECHTEDEQKTVFETLTTKGHKCRLSTF